MRGAHVAHLGHVERGRAHAQHGGAVARAEEDLAQRVVVAPRAPVRVLDADGGAAVHVDEVDARVLAPERGAHGAPGLGLGERALGRHEQPAVFGERRAVVRARATRRAKRVLDVGARAARAAAGARGRGKRVSTILTKFECKFVCKLITNICKFA